MGYLANKYILFKNVHKISKICYFRLSKWEIPTTSNVEWRLLKPGIRDNFSVVLAHSELPGLPIIYRC